MMNKVKLLTIVLSSFLLTFCILGHNAYARECEDQVRENMREQLDNIAKTKIQTMLDTYAQFSSAASDYISNCNKDMKSVTPGLTPSVAVNGKGKELGKNMIPNDKFASYNHNWATEIASTDECKTKLEQAKKTLAVFNQSYNTATRNVQAAMTGGTGGNCTCNEEGEPTCVAMTSDKTDVAEQDGCPPFTSYLNQFTELCPLCGIFEVILNTDAEIATIAWDAVAQPLSNVVKVFFLVLLALEALKAVGAMAGAKISSLLKGVFLIGLKIAVTVLLLSSPRYIYDYFINPVISGGLDLGLAIAQSSGAPACEVENPSSPIRNGAMGTEILNKTYQGIRCFAKSAGTSPAVGRGLLCNSFGAGILGAIPDISMWLSGLIMFGFGLMIWLAVSFYLIDCTVQLGMLTALVPLLIACWPFKMTEQYTTKGVKMMMNTFFNYTLIGVVLMLGTYIMTFAALGGNSNYSMNDLIGALNDNDTDKLSDMTSLDSIQLLILIACSIFALKLLSQTSSIADQFASGSGSQIGNKMGGMATSAATSAVKGGASLTGKAVGGAAKSAYEGSALQANINKTGNAIKGTWAKGWQKAGSAVGLGGFQNQQQGSGKVPTASGGNQGDKDGPNSSSGQGDANGRNNTNGADNTNKENNNGNNTGGADNTNNENNSSGGNNGGGNTPNTPNGGGNNGGGNNNGGDDNGSGGDNGGGNNNGGGDNGGGNNGGGDNGGGDNGGGDNGGDDNGGSNSGGGDNGGGNNGGGNNNGDNNGGNPNSPDIAIDNELHAANANYNKVMNDPNSSSEDKFKANERKEDAEANVFISRQRLQNQFSNSKEAKQLRSAHLQATTPEQRQNITASYLKAEKQFMRQNASPEIYKSYMEQLSKRLQTYNNHPQK